MNPPLSSELAKKADWVGPVFFSQEGNGSRSTLRGTHAAAAGQEVTIVVTDKDTETDDPHNFHVRAGDQNFFTNIEPAPNTQTISFTIETAGVYEFFCDTHALTMNGEFIVEDDM